MGNYYCKVCNVQLQGEGNMCSRCYEKMHLPICSFCKNKINAGEQTLCGVHKFPCYGEMYDRCCGCNKPLAGISTSSFCENCYDSLYPPPRKLHLREGDREITVYSRDDSFREMLEPLGYAIGRGLSDGGNGKRYLQ